MSDLPEPNNSRQRKATTFGSSRNSRKELDSGIEASSGIDADSESIISNDTIEKEHKIDSKLLQKLVHEFKIESKRSPKKKSQLRDAWSLLATKYQSKMKEGPNFLSVYNLVIILQKYYNENNLSLSKLTSWSRNEVNNQSVSEDYLESGDDISVVGGRRGNLLLQGKNLLKMMPLKYRTSSPIIMADFL